MRKVLSLLLALFFAVGLEAQQPSSAPNVAPTAAPNGKFVLEDATPVKLRLSRNVSSADAKTGDTVDFEVVEEVRVKDLIVIPKGGIAWGTVVDAEHKKRMARGGKLNMTIDNVRLVDGEKAALRGVREAAGGGHTGAMTGAIVATAIVVWPAAPFFLFMHGKDITIPKGTEITAYINGNCILDPAKFEPASEVPATLTAPTQAVLSIVSNPSGADIEVDGSFVGNTPSSLSMTAGDHTVKITKPGFVVWERKVRTFSGTVNLSAELQKADSAVNQ